MSDIEFTKYSTRGVDYHWQQVSPSLRRRNPYVFARYRLVTRLAGNGVKGKSLLDVGCGDGVLSWKLAKIGANVTGIDNAESAIKFARNKCAGNKSLDFRVGSAYELPFPDDSFNYLVSTELIEHLGEPEKMLSEMNRVWNRDGRIIITTPTRLTGEPLDTMHVREFFTQDFEHLIRSHFPNEQIEFIVSHPLFWQELQNKPIFGRGFSRVLINLANRVGFDPYLGGGQWRYFTLQTAVIDPSRR